MSDLGARAVIISVIWFSVAIALAFGLSSRFVHEEVAGIAVVFLSVGATVVSLVVWLTKWPRTNSQRGFEVFPAEEVSPIDRQ